MTHDVLDSDVLNINLRDLRLWNIVQLEQDWSERNLSFFNKLFCISSECCRPKITVVWVLSKHSINLLNYNHRKKLIITNHAVENSILCMHANIFVIGLLYIIYTVYGQNTVIFHVGAIMADCFCLGMDVGLQDCMLGDCLRGRFISRILRPVFWSCMDGPRVLCPARHFSRSWGRIWIGSSHILNILWHCIHKYAETSLRAWVTRVKHCNLVFPASWVSSDGRRPER